MQRGMGGIIYNIWLRMEGGTLALCFYSGAVSCRHSAHCSERDSNCQNVIHLYLSLGQHYHYSVAGFKQSVLTALTRLTLQCFFSQWGISLNTGFDLVC